MLPTPEDAADAFITLLDQACRGIDATRFLMPVSTIDFATSRRVYRERVYCYELYHQIRRRERSASGRRAGSPTYALSAEIDKAGLNAVTTGDEKPDLVWHVPGDWGANAVVVEVKQAAPFKPRGVRKDLETLGKFVTAGGRRYRTGVLLLYGSTDRDPARVRERVVLEAGRAFGGRGLTPLERRRIRVLHHPLPGWPVEDLGHLHVPTSALSRTPAAIPAAR